MFQKAIDLEYIYDQPVAYLLLLLIVSIGCEAPTASSTRSTDQGDASRSLTEDARVMIEDDPSIDQRVIDSEGELDAEGVIDLGLSDLGFTHDLSVDLRDAEPSIMGDGCGALQLLVARCAQGGCHLPNNPRTSLVLTMSEIEAGSLDPYVRPNDPEGSHLLDRMIGVGGAPLMPLGVASPIEEVEMIRQWISDGAPTTCTLPIRSSPSDPNHLDADVLFQCEDDRATFNTPARIRRVGRREWTKAVVKPLAGTWWGSTARDNPFNSPNRLPYSTYPSDVTIAPATLDLYLLVLPEAPALWTARDPQGAEGFISGTRTEAVYNNRELRCIFNDPIPDEECIDRYIYQFLREGVLFRAPREDEIDRLRTLLVNTLSTEGDLSDRRASLQHVGEAAFLMAGALFRTELGAQLMDQPMGSRQLTAEEYGGALGHALSAHPVGAPIPISLPSTDPDAATPALGRLGQIRAAVEGDMIFEPEVISALLTRYQGGVDLDRHHLYLESDTRGYPSRGEYWLAENILQFFREWLGYEEANSAFKDSPGATSEWESRYDGNPMWDPTTIGFRNLQDVYYGYESSLVDQLDDTIARAVVESHERQEDVFVKLMTTRMWRLPSNIVNVSSISCDTNDDCDPPFERCISAGRCGTSISNTPFVASRVYHLPNDIPNTHEGRWVEMPRDERAGVLTHPAWLAAHGGNFEDDASAVKRGKWIRERLFCETVPGLELVQVEAKLIAQDPSLSARIRIQRSLEESELNPQAPTCMGCHSLMNSLGYPFEIYNHAGFIRDFDHGPNEGERSPDGSSFIESAPDPALTGAVINAVTYSHRLAESRVARRCFIRHSFRYFIGRDELDSDACVLSEMEASLDRDGSFFSMLEVLLKSDSFKYRSFTERVSP